MLTLHFFVMLTGMTLVKLMGDLVGLLEVAVKAVAEVTVEAVAQVLRGHAVMRLDVVGPRAGAGAGAIIETIMLAAAGAAAQLLALGLKRLLLSQGLLGQTRGTQSTKALQDPTLGMIMLTTLTTRMTITWKMGRWEGLILITRPAHRMIGLLHIVLCTMVKPMAR